MKNKHGLRWVSSEWERGMNIYEHMCVCVYFFKGFLFLFFFNILAALGSMWDLSSLTRD